MREPAIVTIRPVSDRYFHDVRVSVDVIDGDFNRAVRDAKRRVYKTYPVGVVHRFEVLSIDLV